VKCDVPKETKVYIQKVLASYQTYQGHYRVPSEQNGKSGVKTT